MIYSKRHKLITVARQEGMVKLQGNADKAGPEIEKYLSVFRQKMAKSNPNYLNLSVGYDWCCAFVYYFCLKAGFQISPCPLASVQIWYQYALTTQKFFSSFDQVQPGDLVLFDHLLENVALDHIGIVLEIDQNQKTFRTAEGNVRNATGLFHRKMDRTVRGFICL